MDAEGVGDMPKNCEQHEVAPSTGGANCCSWCGEKFSFFQLTSAQRDDDDVLHFFHVACWKACVKYFEGEDR